MLLDLQHRSCISDRVQHRWKDLEFSVCTTHGIICFQVRFHGLRAVGRDGEWFRLHDASGGGFEGAVALAAACVDTDFRRQLYGLPMSVPPEQRQTRYCSHTMLSMCAHHRVADGYLLSGYCVIASPAALQVYLPAHSVAMHMAGTLYNRARTLPPACSGRAWVPSILLKPRLGRMARRDRSLWQRDWVKAQAAGLSCQIPLACWTLAGGCFLFLLAKLAWMVLGVVPALLQCL